MTDNRTTYRSRLLKQSLAERAIRHMCIWPAAPNTNGKADRLIQTLMREWAYRLVHSKSVARNAIGKDGMTSSTGQDHTQHPKVNRPSPQ